MAKTNKCEIGVSPFCSELRAGGRILELPGQYVWCCAPVYDDAGLLHLFFSSWPESSGMPGWRDHSQIFHATAASPEGPYQILGPVFQSGAGDWDASVFNPSICRIGGRFVLVYAGRNPAENPFRMQIGLAVCSADGLASGAWEKTGPVVSPSGVDGTWNALHASNPALLAAPDGTFRIYYKAMGMENEPRLRTIGVAVADRLEGPYRNDPRNPLMDYRSQGGDIEDPCVFFLDGKYYLIAEDRTGVATGGDSSAAAGGTRPGLIYESDDGFRWEPPRTGYQTNDFYFGGPRERFERPQILWKNGRPEALFLALKGGRYGTSSGAFLKINSSKGS
jgi:hypothetical protein